jgi:hypothetical protein
MKVQPSYLPVVVGQLLALGAALNHHVVPASAFTSSAPSFATRRGGAAPSFARLASTKAPSEGVVSETDPGTEMSPDPEDQREYMRSKALFPGATSRRTDLEPTPDNIRPVSMFPLELSMDRIEGSGTVRNYKIPPWAERVQYVLTTNGRPLKATVELWVGPIRKTHTLEISVENGQKTPVRATLKFKKGTEVITIRTSDAGELPCSACVVVPSPDRSKALGANTERVFDSNPRTRVQGGIIQPDGESKGAVRYFNVPPDVEAVQVLLWSKNTGKKSLKAKIEVLQGPNNPKQSFDLQCGGGSQPYHAVFETPGGGGVLRIINKKFLEDGLFEVAVVPIALSELPNASEDDFGPNSY